MKNIQPRFLPWISYLKLQIIWLSGMRDMASPNMVTEW